MGDGMGEVGGWEEGRDRRMLREGGESAESASMK